MKSSLKENLPVCLIWIAGVLAVLVLVICLIYPLARDTGFLEGLTTGGR